MFKASLLGILFVVSACKGKTDGTKAADTVEPAGVGGETIAKLTEFKTKMCACTDAKCAQGVTGELTAYSTKPPVKLTRSESDQIAAISKDLGACMQKASAPTSETK